MNKFFGILAVMLGMTFSLNGAQATVVENQGSFSSQSVSFGKSSHFDTESVTTVEAGRFGRAIGAGAGAGRPRSRGGR